MPKKATHKKKSVVQTRRPRVLMAMSGGVDSSVAAALLVKQGYDVTGAYMINYDNNEQGSMNKEQPALQAIARSAAACWVPDYRDALRVAAKLEIPLLKLDFTKEYKEKVLDYMFAEYEKGRTPNPDVLCNKYIKFGVWMDKAKELGFDFLATGHYAQVKTIKSKLTPTSYRLQASRDSNKDQTYFLHQLNQEQLSRTLFPIGKYTKDQVRKLAQKFDLPTATKAESMGICFVGEVPMDAFLKTRIKPKPGNIVFSDGTILGQHEGLPFYTIGQRHIGVKEEGVRSKEQANQPLYVVDKRIASNELVVGYENDPLLYKKETVVTNMHWINGFIHRSSQSEDGQEPELPLQCLVRLRHRQPLVKCLVKKEENTIRIEFSKPERAVTPGQFAVVYSSGKTMECLGGGVIA